MLMRDDEKLAAARPQPGVYPVFDVQSLQRRADIERGKLRMMIDYAYYPRCRRQYILEYFGDVDWTNRDKRCGACDNCTAVAEGKVVGLSETEVKAVRSLLMLVGSLNGRFGRTRIAAIANGSEDDARFDEMPERGALRGWSGPQIMDLLRALEGAGLVETSRGEYPTISTTRKGDQVGIGTLDPNDLGLQMPTVTKRSRVRKRKR
jgi:ATP-dependent DNA helicase RecQ